ncbi:RusA-like Holliday junction resolvase [Dinoroseobacter phage vB_DshP-R7L]|uniref:Uncharacterized protein n=1 Tax=Dinoroseobacter phage vB_DshP-R7L TaxID=2873349 RepID=A0AAE9BMF2_9CAUD|nr:RusA-like Holliday junction resolvase [Dinoroseobacter phage vB_DshP-R7L]UAT28903.1 hypothetical protein R7L_gp64 [Dinoroseobacter phage vB_DshP-R7L]
MVDSYSVRIPTYVLVSKTNQKAVNLNVYRNLHHHHLNTQKKNFADEVKPLLKDKPRAEKIWIHYTVFAPSNRRLDTMNVGSIADKYFSDTMVEAGKIPDDNQEHIVLSTFSFGGLSKMDGHAIATVHILDIKEEEPENMRILLDQEDIQAALNAYVKTLQLPKADTATVELAIEDDEIVAEVIMGEAPVKNRGGRPRNKPGPKPKTEKVTADAVEEAPDSSDEGSGADNDSGSGDTTTSDAEEGAKTTAPTEGKTKKGNLFGDEESPSSDSTEAEKTEDSPPAKKTTVVKPAKKSSIFDVD